MTSNPPSENRRNAAFFSAAWSAFTRMQKTAPPSDAAAAEAPEVAELEEHHSDASVQEETVADAAPPTGRRLAASAAASAVISARMKPGFAESCFSGLSHGAFLALPLLLLAQFAAGYYTLTPWLLPQEARFAEAYELMVASGQWLAAPIALPPAWFWLLRLLNALPYVDGPLVYAAGAAFSGVFVLLATWFLALSAGYDRRSAFASGLALLSCLAFPALAHRVGPELFFTGLLTLGLACLCRGWNKEFSFLWLPLGGVFMALAGLTGGLFGIILPVLGSLAFLTWKGTFSRFNKLDGAAAFALLLALPLAWLGAMMLFGPNETSLRTLCAQLLAPFLPPYWPPEDPAWLYAAVLPTTLVPWMLVPFFVSWRSALARPFRLLASTRKENSGSAWIWIHLAAGFLLLSAMSTKFCLNILPLMPLLAIALGKAVMNLPQANSRAFFLVLAGLFGLAALALGLAGIAQTWPQLQSFAPVPYPKGFTAIKGLPVLAGICLLAAFALWKLVDRRFPGACMLICALAVTVLCVPALRLTSPSMQDIFLDKAGVPQSIPAAPATAGSEETASVPKPDEKAAPAVDTSSSKTPEALGREQAAPAEAQPERTPDNP